MENERRPGIGAGHRGEEAGRRRQACISPAAESAERDRREQLRELKSQVADMQRGLDEARLQAGRAKNDLRKAEQALERAQR